MIAARMVRTRPDGLPVYGYEPAPGLPPVAALTLDEALDDAGGVPPRRVHAHEFFVVVFFERDGGSLRMAAREWSVTAGDVYLIAPGDVVGVGADIARLRGARGRAVSFCPEILGTASTGSVLSWQAHPLLFPFAQHTVSEPKRWNIRIAHRANWSARLQAIDDELRQRQHGHRDAVAAHLTLLLLDIARLATPAPDHASFAADPLLAEVLAYIDQHYHDPTSLNDVARAVNLSPGHLTTVIARRTGRSVHAWITQRRLAEARRLLADSNLAIDEIGRQVGYRDPSYFARTFRKNHGTTPSGWRQAARTRGQEQGPV